MNHECIELLCSPGYFESIDLSDCNPVWTAAPGVGIEHPPLVNKNGTAVQEAGNSVATRARGLQHPKGSRQHQNGRKVNVHVKASGLDASSPPINHSNHNSHHAADMSPPARFPPSDISPSAQAPPSERHIAAVSKGVSLGDHASIEVRCCSMLALQMLVESCGLEGIVKALNW